MPAPRDIVDSLESVISIYFSDVRHKYRAAFILTDELVEMSCKAVAISSNPTLGRINFPDLLRHPSVRLSMETSPLGATLFRNHDTRNKMQHVNAAFTFDEQHCADAVLDAVAAIEHCFPGTALSFPDAISTALRVVRLQSSQGDGRLRGNFEDAMRSHRWNGGGRASKVTEPPYPVGSRRYWSLVLLPEYSQVELILNRLGVA
jgi:hypothetical protein